LEAEASAPKILGTNYAALSSWLSAFRFQLPWKGVTGKKPDRIWKMGRGFEKGGGSETFGSTL
jgi:hypothetical protein